jgi:hypothetical protein
MLQGVLRIRGCDCGHDPVGILVKLWVHEHGIVYHSRCTRPEDASFVKELLHRIAQRKLGSQENFETFFGSEPLVFSEFLTITTTGIKTSSSHHTGTKPYELVTSMYLPLAKCICNFVAIILLSAT